MPKLVIQNRITEHLAIKARKEGSGRYTQDEIMEATGMSRQTVSTHMRNKVLRYDLETIATWCHFLNISPEEFFTWGEVEDDSEAEMKSPLLATA